MSKLKLSTLLISTLLLALSVAAEPTRSTSPRAPRFSSLYTDLNRDCKSALTKKEEKEAEATGTDIPMRCKGYGGYSIYIYYSAAAAHWVIEMQGRDDVSISLGTHPLNYTEEKGRKVEWRLADGKPFAVIMREGEYSGAPTTEEMFDPKYKTGESLIIQGLKGYEYIEGQIDAKTPNANERAREIADKAFLKGSAD